MFNYFNNQVKKLFGNELGMLATLPTKMPGSPKLMRELVMSNQWILQMFYCLKTRISFGTIFLSKLSKCDGAQSVSNEIEDAKKLKLIKHLDVVINDNGKLFIERSITLKSIKWHQNRLIHFEFVVEPIQKQSNVETLVERAQELESKFVDFITKRSDIPIEQFDQIWLWNLFASIYNIDSTIDIQPAFAVFVHRLWFQPIEADIKLKFMRYFKIKIDFIIKDFIISYHDVNITSMNVNETYSPQA
ncbi:unnamed protein product [Caenorhabditis angaria]|uniref:Uncharacterized protein n=1 Tax=Caenorhabditis angaria TaxID=860376 RepID=A0A9P1ID27_9PELO|nr:unnamed protein product [Caenorhabditis angaria]